jgi:predicted enzyme related to lactoylglutathione lyase
MAKALGIGGIFFKSPDPARLQKWYAEWLGISVISEEGISFAIFQPGAMPEKGYTVWSAFDSGTTYFAPSGKEFMFNLVVDNLEEALSQVAAGGAQVVGEVQKSEYGSFGWFMDPDGNKVELWQPPES